MTRVRGLPPPVNTYTISRDEPIRTRDGAVLLADVYAPIGESFGTILVRSPYGWPVPMAAMTAGVFATRGYHVVLARCRGTFGSSGPFEPFVHEIDDAADTVAWMREQPWFEQRFATFGGSYLGFTQWALLMDPPPELVAAVVSIAPHDFRDAVYPGGAFALADFLGWSHQVGHQEAQGVARYATMFADRRRLGDAMRELPLVAATDGILGGQSPWYPDWVSERDADDPMWAPMQCGAALDRVTVPVLLHGGWQDLFVSQTVEQYERLRARGVDVAMTIGPWTHGQTVTKGGRVMVQESLAWFDEHLRGSGVRTRATPVKIYVTGAKQWRDLPDWPSSAATHSLHPRADEALGSAAAPTGTAASFLYDPRDPTPSIGGPTLVDGGTRDDTDLAGRGDVLAFTGPPLSAPLEIVGTVVVQLEHASDPPHADLFVRLSEVDSAGRSRNVTDGFVRLDADRAGGAVRLALSPIAHRFAAGSRVRLLVAGGAFPRWERNLGTGEDPATSSDMVAVRHTIDLSATRVELPVTIGR